MDAIILSDATTGSTAHIAPHLGFNCYDFQADVDGQLVSVIDADPNFVDGDKRPSGNGIPILFPYPSRIRGGRFHWNGNDYFIPPGAAAHDPTGNSIHGFCLDRAWRVTAQGDHFVVGEFQLSVDAPDRLPFWPGDCLIEVRYELRQSVLRADFRVANPGTVAIPWGLGTHAYFRLPLTAAGDSPSCLIQAPVTQQWDLVELLPTGQRSPLPAEKDLSDGVYLGGTNFDDVLTGLQVSPGQPLECLMMDELSGLQIVQVYDPVFRELVVYTPPNRQAVCMEPYTCVTDAVNLQQQGLDAGLQILEPGQEFRTWIEIRVGRVLA